jgi:regulator of cell morphogenesis and NO signaling
MDTITPDSTVAEIVTQFPSTAALFDELGIDFCCGGDLPLLKAAGQRALDAETIIATLSALDAVQGDTAGAHDVKDLDNDELIDHIVDVHHAGVRKQIPMIQDLLETVVRVHHDDASLPPLRDRFDELAAELIAHMKVEEERLFPFCRRFDSDLAPEVDQELLGELVHEHEDVGRALVDLRRMAGDYDLERAHCNTHRFLLQSMMEFEEDMHVHVHEENNVLFARTRATAVR